MQKGLNQIMRADTMLDSDKNLEDDPAADLKKTLKKFEEKKLKAREFRILQGVLQNDFGKLEQKKKDAQLAKAKAKKKAEDLQKQKEEFKSENVKIVKQKALQKTKDVINQKFNGLRMSLPDQHRNNEQKLQELPMTNTSSRKTLLFPSQERLGPFDTDSSKNRNSVAGLSQLSEREGEEVEQKTLEDGSHFYKGMVQIDEQSVDLASESSQKPYSVSQNVDSGTSLGATNYNAMLDQPLTLQQNR